MKVRRYTPADEPQVRAIFRDTLVLGRPLEFAQSWRAAPWQADYERLCLNWFLGPGGADAGVLEDDDRAVRGYVLVCTDLRAYRRWATRAAIGWTLRTLVRLAAGRLRPEAARFHRLRLRDGWEALRAPSAPMPACVHVNVDATVRSGLPGRLLARHADERCRALGLPGWFGEINARAGRRAAALASAGITPVHRQPNHTLSWLAGRPVERLTVVRDINVPLERGGSTRLRAAS